jgi:Transposase DDE domain
MPRRARVGAVMLLGAPPLLRQQAQILELATKARLPSSPRGASSRSTCSFPRGLGPTGARPEIVAVYRQRMQIEQSFRDFKTHLGIRGLPLKVRVAERLGRLLLTFCLAYALLVFLGLTPAGMAARADLEILWRNAPPRHAPDLERALSGHADAHPRPPRGPGPAHPLPAPPALGGRAAADRLSRPRPSACPRVSCKLGGGQSAALSLTAPPVRLRVASTSTAA